MSYPFIFLQGPMQGLAQNICRKLHAGEEEGRKRTNPFLERLSLGFWGQRQKSHGGIQSSGDTAQQCASSGLRIAPICHEALAL